MNQFIDQSFKDIKQLISDNVPPDNRFIWLDPVLIDEYIHHCIEIVSNQKIMKIDAKMPIGNLLQNANIIVITRNHLICHIANNIKQATQKFPNLSFFLFVIPRLTEDNDFLLRQFKVMDNITQYFPLRQFFYKTYDLNVYSMQFQSQVFKNSLSAPLLHAEALFGIIQSIGGASKITAKGQVAVNALKCIERLQQEQSFKEQDLFFKEIVLIDRLTDLTSFLITGQNFSEQLSLHLDFKNNRIEKLPLYQSTDSVFEQLAHFNIQQIGDRVEAIIRQAQEKRRDLENLQKDKSKNMEALKVAAEKSRQAIQTGELVKNLFVKTKALLQKRNSQVAENYLFQKDITKERVKFDFLLQNIINNQFDLNQSMQIVLLYNFFIGFKQKELLQINKQLIQMFGAPAEQIFYHFQQMNLFSPAYLQKTQELLKQYGVVQNDVQEEKLDPTKLNYCYNFIQPLSVRIVENIIVERKGENRKLKVVQDSLPTRELRSSLTKTNQQQRILVMFIGPLTHAEAGSFDVLRKNYDELIVCCDELVDGSQVIKKMCESAM